MILYKKDNNETVRVDGAGSSNGGCTDCLPKTNTLPFTPTEDYNPVTKKYVDDLVGDISEILDAINKKPDSENSDGNKLDDSNKPDNDKPSDIGTDANNWDYILNETDKTITIWRYIGSNNTVTVYGKYNLDGTVYQTKLASYDDTRFKQELEKEHYYMFHNNTTIKNISFNNGIDTTDTLRMDNMFRLTDLQTLDIKNLDTSHTKSFIHMFCNTSISNGILNLSTFNTSNATNMWCMFESCHCNSILVPNFDTSKVLKLPGMFANCRNLQKLDLTSFNTSSIEDQQQSAMGMFLQCTSLEEIKVSAKLWTIDPKKVPTLFTECNISSFTYV